MTSAVRSRKFSHDKYRDEYPYRIHCFGKLFSTFEYLFALRPFVDSRGDFDLKMPCPKLEGVPAGS